MTRDEIAGLRKDDVVLVRATVRFNVDSIDTGVNLRFDGYKDALVSHENIESVVRRSFNIGDSVYPAHDDTTVCEVIGTCGEFVWVLNPGHVLPSTYRSVDLTRIVPPSGESA